MAETSKSIQERDARYAEHSRQAGEMKADNVNEDGSVSDPGAQAAAERAAQNASTPPNDRVPDDHSVGTPAWVEENSPSGLHSDGGNTLAPEAPSVREQAGWSSEDVQAQDEAIAKAAKDAEDKREERRKAAENKEDEQPAEGEDVERGERSN